MGHLYSRSRLIRTEMFTLVGLMVRADPDYDAPVPANAAGLAELAEALLLELHDSMTCPWMDAFHNGMAAGDPPDPWRTGDAMREPIFYGGEAAFSFQNCDFAALKYAADDAWLIRNRGASIVDMIAVGKAVGELQSERLGAAFAAAAIPLSDPRVLAAFIFSVADLAPRLWVVRHGESAGNVARDVAHEGGLARIKLTHRDVDVPLSDLGREQSRALGHWFASFDLDKRPEIMLASPYLRAVETARLFRAAGGCLPDERICIDERLREKEFGILDGLTTTGVTQYQPEQAEFRKMLGKFYHRPPGGESWVDVIFRLRAMMDTISLHYGGRRVLIVAHQVVVLCLRYIIENLTEEEILAIDGEGDVANCAITEYRLDSEAGRDGQLTLARYNVIAPMTADSTLVTTAPDKIVAARG